MSVSRQILPAASDVWSARCSLHIHVLWLAATDCFTLQCLTIGQSPVIIRAAQYSNDCSSQNCWYRPVITLPPVHTCAPHCRHHAAVLQSSCGSSGPGCGYIAPSTIRLTSVWTQTCINLQEDKLRVLHRFRVSPHQIFCGSRYRGDGRRMQWYKHGETPAPRQSPAARARKYILQ